MEVEKGRNEEKSNLLSLVAIFAIPQKMKMSQEAQQRKLLAAHAALMRPLL